MRRGSVRRVLALQAACLATVVHFGVNGALDDSGRATDVTVGPAPGAVVERTGPDLEAAVPPVSAAAHNEQRASRRDDRATTDVGPAIPAGARALVTAPAGRRTSSSPASEIPGSVFRTALRPRAPPTA
jgi:hypothetical protein